MRIAWLCLVLAGGACGAELHYKAIPRADIEVRLRMAAGSNAKREQALEQLFRDAGCPSDALTEQKVPHVKEPNVICTLPGELASTILIGAHFDFVNEGKGVIDNWSGAALLPSLVQGLLANPRRHTFVFIGFTAEEKGMVGSRYYVSQLDPEQRRQIRGMINLDSLAAGPTNIDPARADKGLINSLAIISQTLKLPLGAVDVHKVGESDSDSFQDAQIPAILLHSITQESFAILHRSLDKLEAVKWDDYYDSYRLLAAYLAYLDGKLDETPPAAP